MDKVFKICDIYGSNQCDKVCCIFSQGYVIYYIYLIGNISVKKEILDEKEFNGAFPSPIYIILIPRTCYGKLNVGICSSFSLHTFLINSGGLSEKIDFGNKCEGELFNVVKMKNLVAGIFL